MENIFIKLKNLNNKAKINGDVPVSCIILKDEKIVSSGYNKREYKKNPLLHAEVVAILNASKKLNTWNLSNCILISTLKPCKMCEEIIKLARIREVFYILDNKKNTNNKYTCSKIESSYSDYFSKEIKEFFKDKR